MPAGIVVHLSAEEGHTKLIINSKVWNCAALLRISRSQAVWSIKTLNSCNISVRLLSEMKKREFNNKSDKTAKSWLDLSQFQTFYYYDPERRSTLKHDSSSKLFKKKSNIAWWHRNCTNKQFHIDKYNICDKLRNYLLFYAPFTASKSYRFTGRLTTDPLDK